MEAEEQDSTHNIIMGVFDGLRRIFLLAFLCTVLISMPLFKAYGFGTNRNKVRVAPLSYFFYGLEQLDFVKKSKLIKGMANDAGTWLHLPGVIAEDYGIPQFFEEQLKYKSIWKTQQQERSKKNVKKSKKKSKKQRKKQQEQEEEQARKNKKTYMQRAKAWRDDLNGIKDMSKGDVVGVAAGGLLIISR